MAYMMGKYSLLAKIGTGGMADVFLAVSQGPLGFNKLVVVKRMHRALAADESLVTLFRDEARVAALLSHPNVVNTFEVGEARGLYFLAMEYLEGHHLGRLLRAARRQRGVFSHQHLLCAVTQALEGLHYAHELCDYDGTCLNIVHRDISPQNIVVTYDGEAKIVDFGIAKTDLSGDGPVRGPPGKVGYMAPEQMQGHPVDRRSDLFSMGIILWEMVTHRRLYAGDLPSVMNKLLTEPAPAVSSITSGVPDALAAVVAKSLQRDPDLRYQSAAEMRDAIFAYVESTGKIVTKGHLAERMQSVFAAKRQKARARVQQVLTAQLQEAETRGPDPQEQASAPVPGLVLDPPTDSDSDAASTPTPLPEPEVAPAPPPAPDPEQADESADALEPAGSTARLSFATAAGIVLAVGLVIGGVMAVRDAGKSAEVPAARDQAASPGVPVSSPGTPAVRNAKRDDPEAKVAVRLTSEPSSAFVQWNGSRVGTTPLRVETPPGRQSFLITKPGYQSETLVVEVQAPDGDDAEPGAEAHAVLERLPVPEAPSPKPTSAPGGPNGSSVQRPASEQLERNPPGTTAHKGARRPASAPRGSSQQPKSESDEPPRAPRIELIDGGRTGKGSGTMWGSKTKKKGARSSRGD